MTRNAETTPWRARYTCALRTWVAIIKRRCVALRARRKHPHIRSINAHIARDIGISAAQQAQLNHRHPSQHTHHPYG